MTPALAAALAELGFVGRDVLLAGFHVFLRVGAAMALIPGFGEQSVPVRVRLALALALTLIVTPAVAPVLTPLLAREEVIGLPMVTETLIGLAIGIALRLFILALQMAGTIAAQSTSLSQFFGGAGVEPQPAISQLLVVAGLALAMMYGLHLQAAKLLILSYDALPPGRFPTATEMSRWGLGQISHAVVLALSLTMPFVIASLIYNVALGVINKAMPALMVSFIGAPALALGGLALLFLVMPLVMSVWIADFGRFLKDPFSVPLP